MSLLREGTLSGGFHPSCTLIARHCRHYLEKDGLESTTLHILGMLKDGLANFPTQVSFRVHKSIVYCNGCFTACQVSV